MTFNLVLCENFTFPSFKCAGKHRNSKRKTSVINEINDLLSDPEFDRDFICTHVLNKLVQLTKSEYGFLGKVVYEPDGSPILHTFAITNIAWNSSSQQFFLDHIQTKLCFTNMDTLFGDVILSGEPRLVNRYDATKRAGILPHGHPPIKRFMGVPALVAGRTIAMLGVCNKAGKYNKQDILNTSDLLSVLSYLFVDMSYDYSIAKPCCRKPPMVVKKKKRRKKPKKTDKRKGASNV